MIFKVKNKNKNNLKNPRMLMVLLAGLILIIATFFIYQNIVILFTTFLSILILVFYLLSKPKEIQLKIDLEKFVYDKIEIDWDSIVGWAIIDLGNTLEFMIHTSGFGVNFYYFYTDKEDIQTSQIASILAENIPYNQEITDLDRIHLVLRFLNLL